MVRNRQAACPLCSGPREGGKEWPAVAIPGQCLAQGLSEGGPAGVTAQLPHERPEALSDCPASLAPSTPLLLMLSPAGTLTPQSAQPSADSWFPQTQFHGAVPHPPGTEWHLTRKETSE